MRQVVKDKLLIKTSCDRVFVIPTEKEEYFVAVGQWISRICLVRFIIKYFFHVIVSLN